jgi:hypothetical protein
MHYHWLDPTYLRDKQLSKLKDKAKAKKIKARRGRGMS